MSEATVPQPDADNGWDNIDEAVRDQYGQLLTAGTNLLSDSEIMRRLDPLFSPVAYEPLCGSHLDKVAGAWPAPLAKWFAPPQLRPCARSAAPRRTRRNMARTGDSQMRPGARTLGTVAQRDLPRLRAGSTGHRPRHGYAACRQAEGGVRRAADDRRFGPYQLRLRKPGRDQEGIGYRRAVFG